MSIRIILADKHRILRKGIRALLSRETDIEVIGEAKTGKELVPLARELAPDIVIIGVSLPEMNGIEATRKVISEIPGTRVIALSVKGGNTFVRNMFKAGASGYILKNCTLEELTIGIRTVANGNKYLGQGVTDLVIKDYVRRRSSPEPGTESQLTKRERIVLQLLAEGKSSREIARELQISAKTVETHRRRITTKLRVKSIAGLTKYALREGITSLD